MDGEHHLPEQKTSLSSFEKISHAGSSAADTKSTEAHDYTSQTVESQASNRPNEPMPAWDWPDAQAAGKSSKKTTVNHSQTAAVTHSSPSKKTVGPSQIHSKESTVNLRLGEAAPTNLRFCPILALAKFPYKFLPGHAIKSSQAIATRFFDKDQFWERTWDLYVLSIRPHFKSEK